MVQALNTVKKVAITVVKSEAFKTGLIYFAAGSGALIGFEVGAVVSEGIDGVKKAIKGCFKKKKGLDKDYSETTVEETVEETTEE